MKLIAAHRICTSLMEAHGLIAKGWSLHLIEGRGIKVMGACRHSDKSIHLSAATLAHSSQAEVVQLCLHEIAHALVPGGHTMAWMDKAREIEYLGGRASSNPYVLAEFRRLFREAVLLPGTPDGQVGVGDIVRSVRGSRTAVIVKRGKHHFFAADSRARVYAVPFASALGYKIARGESVAFDVLT